MHFGNDYNKSFNEGVLPQHLTELHFGREFNQFIAPNILPKSLTTLIFGKMFNYQLNGVLGVGLTKLVLGDEYDYPFDKNVLPNTLLDLTISSSYKHSLDPLIELKIQSLMLETWEYECTHPWTKTHLKIELNTIPKTVQKLHLLDKTLNQSLNSLLPEGLIELALTTRHIEYFKLNELP